MLTLTVLKITILASSINYYGDIQAVVEFPGEKQVQYIIQGCESPNFRWIHRENMINRWVLDGPSVKDKIATDLCNKHFTMGRM